MTITGRTTRVEIPQATGQRVVACDRRSAIPAVLHGITPSLAHGGDGVG